MASTTKVAFMDNSWQPAVGNTPESLRQFVESQRELFHIQIDQLQKIVSTQCKLTGVNPLSQEMAAGALSIKIGKRPRDLLNPKAIKYMQSIFSIKDAVSKKESREISALFGVTVTQVRDFFAGQRSRVRKFFQLSRDKTVRSNACESPQDGFLMTSSPVVIIDPTPLDTVNPAKLDEPPSCSTQDEALLAIDESEKRFVESIFSLMRKEETFSAQEKLMEWILQIKNASILYWFLNKGGVMILATWLSEAALEEQTTVLFIILKVLCHLPLHKAFPEHMSAILQSVNRLRFYQSPDISNRARVLLSRWSKLFARSQALKKPNGLKSSVDAQKEMLLKQSISEIIDDELWQSKTADPDENLDHSRENSDNLRKSEPHQTPKVPPVSTDDSKNNRGVYSSQTRERRKVVLVEPPGQKTASRSQPGAKVKPANQGRPISADDIQKAKLRAQYMQSKYGKVGSNESNEPKIEGPNRSLSARAGVFLLPSKVNLRPKIEEQRKPAAFNRQGAPCLKRPLSESLLAKCKRVQLPWRTPPEIRMNEIWRVGAGESSKEVEIQKNRNHRDKETFYRTVHDIPPNPQEPWDTEIDCDDTLTPEIPTEPLPDADITTEPHHVPAKEADTRAAVSSTATPSQLSSGDDAVEPDFELLAILLKNPELVFALTSGQAGSLSHEQTVKLLDVIKRTGAGLPGNLNPLGGRSEEKVEVSLPSPTPSSHLGMSGWPSEAARNPFTKQRSTATATVYASAAVATTSIPLQQPADLATTLERYATVPDGLPSVQRTHLSYETSRVLHSHTPEIEPWKRAPLVGTYAGHNVSAGTATQTHAKFGAFGTSEMDFTSPAVLSQAPSSPYQIRPVGNPDPTHDSWRERQRMPSKDYSRFDQSNCSSFVGGFVRRPGLFSDQSIGRNELGTTREEFESWSPEGSPNRPSCRKYSEPRINPGPYSRYSQSYRHEFSRNQSSSSSGYRESTGRGSRRWRDGDRRR